MTTKKGGVESSVGVVQREFWYLDNRMQPKEGNVGANTSREARELEDVGVRLAHMDDLGIDVQVLSHFFCAHGQETLRLNMPYLGPTTVGWRRSGGRRPTGLGGW